MNTVRDLLPYKSSDVWTIGPYATVFQALELMAEKNVGALPVLQEGKLIGIFSERDYAREMHPDGPPLQGNARAGVDERARCDG